MPVTMTRPVASAIVSTARVERGAEAGLAWLAQRLLEGGEALAFDPQGRAARRDEGA